MIVYDGLKFRLWPETSLQTNPSVHAFEGSSGCSFIVLCCREIFIQILNKI